jgi:glycosyltransferase involved in cell wall biosynthesis
MTATVIIPTTGTKELKDAIESVLKQSYPTICYVVCDGDAYRGKVKVIADQYAGDKNLKISYLPINVGSNGFYGHRVYASFTHLINTEYVMYLDQDNWLQPNHVQSCVDTMNDKKLLWCHSLRNIYDKESNFICQDNCESLGKHQAYTNTNHIDTNTYCLKTEFAIRVASVWHGGWGHDRVFLNTIKHFDPWDCTGEYTVNYRVDGGEGSVSASFFQVGNEIMNKKYNGDFPWKKKI